MSANVKGLYLQFNGSEFGPLSSDEVNAVLGSGRIKGPIFLWKAGLNNWMPLETGDDFARILRGDLTRTHHSISILSLPKPLSVNSENRGGSRQPLVATVCLKLREASPVLGVCANISETGFQVITQDEYPIVEGQAFRMEIHPLSVFGLPVIACKAQVMWISAADQRMGFKMVEVSDSDKQALRKHLNALRNRAGT